MVDLVVQLKPDEYYSEVCDFEVVEMGCAG